MFTTFTFKISHVTVTWPFAFACCALGQSEKSVFRDLVKLSVILLACCLQSKGTCGERQAREGGESKQSPKYLGLFLGVSVWSADKSDDWQNVNK